MARSNKHRTRATIIKLPDSTPGLLFAVHGQMPFTIERVWKSATAPAINMVVELETNSAGAPVGIWVVDSRCAGRQEPRLWGTPAGERFHLLADPMDKVNIGANAFLWLACFALPAVRLDAGFLTKSITFWELISVDFQSFDLHGHGVFRLLGLACLAAPLAAPFWASALARLLYWLPITFLLVAAQRAALNLAAAFDKTRETRQWFSIEVGTYVLLVAAIVIALRAFRSGVAKRS